MSFAPPAPPVKPRNNTRTVLIVVGIVLTLCCIGGVIGGVVLFRGVSEAIGPARDAAEAYVDDVMAENYPSAYRRLCSRVRDRTSEAEFTRVQSAQLKISSYKVVGTNVQTMNATTTARVTMRMTQASTGLEVTQTIPLLKENGEWRVCE
jgi:hypothetical protein